MNQPVITTVEYLLKDVDIPSKTGVLVAKFNDEKVRRIYQVDVSDLMVKMIKDQRKGETKTLYENNVFKSTNTDPLYNHNPFKLVAFFNKVDGSLRNFRVQHVKEAGKHKKSFYDSFGRMSFVEGWRYHKASEFIRYAQYEVEPK